MRELLKHKYEELQEMCGDALQNSSDNINFIIRRSLNRFLSECEQPAIWCYGHHTKMLMADFMFELKKVHYIIDNGIKSGAGSGFELITEGEIKEKGIDGIIISSKLYRKEIIDNIRNKYKDIRYLDIYADLEAAGVLLKEEYYAGRHPYSKYINLNKMQNEALLIKNKNDRMTAERKIVGKYIEIKDFRSAIVHAKTLVELSNEREDRLLLKKIEEIYDLQLEALGCINEEHVVMLCIDGLRRQDICKEYMKNLYSYLTNETHYFSNAYSVSTSTYESLIPAYSENTDLRTKYYESKMVSCGSCRFINEAKKQGRKIFFYTDGTAYIDDADIDVNQKFQTATEKLWDFLLDAEKEENGLFYIHILYESHYSYPNPYTKGEIIAEGTSIFFNYLEKNGGKIPLDFNRQQKDSLCYLDDVVIPLIEKIKCRMVLYADHGNVLFEKGTVIHNIEKSKYTFHEDLIQVPLAIRSPEVKLGNNLSLVSIMELNNIVISLMNKKEVLLSQNEYIKIIRSRIYNPDFIFLYKKAECEHELLAFEAFIFREGYKLAVYEDGVIEVYLANGDSRINNSFLERKLLEKVKDKITVCDTNLTRKEHYGYN